MKLDEEGLTVASEADNHVIFGNKPEIVLGNMFNAYLKTTRSVPVPIADIEQLTKCALPIDRDQHVIIEKLKKLVKGTKKEFDAV